MRASHKPALVFIFLRLLSARPLHRIVQLHHRHLAATITASGREGIDCCFARRLSKRRPYDLELVSSLIRRAFHNPGSPPWIHRRVEPVAKAYFRFAVASDITKKEVAVLRSTTCSFTSRRGHQISARLDRPSGAPLGAVIFAHCFTGSKDSPVARRLVDALIGQGFAVLSFDFAGLGTAGSDAANSTFSADVEDLRVAAEYLATVVAPPSLLIGHSLGGAAVLSAAPNIPSVQAVATIAAPADPSHVRELIADGGTQVMRDGSGSAHIGGRNVTIGKSFLEDLEQQNPLKTIASFPVPPWCCTP